MPLFSGKLKVHDALMLCVIVTLEILSSIGKTMSASVWQFYLSETLGTIGNCKYALVRYVT